MNSTHSEQDGTATEAVVDEFQKRVGELLNEEKWTRATLANYTINNFKDLDEFLDEVLKSGRLDLVKNACLEHLHHTKNSIIALYMSGIISLSQHLVDDSNLVTLINIFTDNHKWNIVEYLANRILQFGENKLALRTLAECYNNENEIGKMHDVWERLIRVDYEEAEIVRNLAILKEENEETEEAIDYYKKALHRFINKKHFTSVREVWQKLIRYVPEETEFFFHAERKVAKIMSGERAIQLLEDLYPHFKDGEKWNQAIDILKRVLEYDAKSSWARKEIVDCFHSRYSNHSQLAEYIRLSNLSATWRNIHDAVADFEKHIAFDAGNFVYHRTWGVGRINAITDDEVVIDFVKKRGHAMKLKMAVGALSILSRQHIWVLKSVMKKEKLREKIKADIPWALKTIIQSLDNAADMKQIKNELVPAVLTSAEWTSWSTAARNILKKDTNFGNLPDRLDTFVVRDQPISFDEKAFNKFKAEKSFFGRLQTIQDFIFMNEGEPDSEFFAEMFDYFVNFARAGSNVSEFVISSALLVRKIVAQYPFLNPGLTFDFAELFGRIENVVDVFGRIDNAEIRRDCLIQIRKSLPDWPEKYVALFPYSLSRFILDELLESGYRDKVKQLFGQIVGNYREYREPFVWLAKNYFDDEWYAELGIAYEKILIGMIHLLDITGREIENRKDASANRRIHKQILVFLFKDGNLAAFIMRADEESLVRIYTLVEDVKDLDPSIKIEMRHRIIERFPDFRFIGPVEKDTVAGRGFLVTLGSYEAKRKALHQILEIEIPANSKEIGHAISLGDLRENAEYKAAKERQEFLNATVGKLNDEIDRAQVVNRNEVDPQRVSFGTRVTLRNLDSDATEDYVILGPWESDPNKGVISYQSPFGGELWNHKVGEVLDFTINERRYNYRVEAVAAADF